MMVYSISYRGVVVYYTMLIEKEILNRYVDEKNAIMLTMLGLHETVELFKTRGKTKYWIKNNCFCFNIDAKINGTGVFQYPLTRLFEPGNVLHLLDEWGSGVLYYVD